MSIGRLDIEVAANIAAFSQNMSKATADISKFTSTANQVKNIALGNFVSQAAIGALQQLSQAFSGALDQAQRFQDVAGRLGGAEGLATAVQAIGLAFADLGISFADTEAGLDKLGKAIVDFSAGKSTKAAQAIGLLSTTFQNMVRDGAPLEQVIAQLTSELTNMAPSAERTFIAMNLLGKAFAGEILGGAQMTAAAMQALIEKNLAAAASWQSLAGTVEQFQNTMSAAATRAFAPLADVINIVIQSLGLLQPAFDQLGNALVEVGNLVLEATNALFGIQDGFSVAVAAAGAFMGAIAATVSALAGFIQACVAAAKAAAAALGAIVSVGRALNEPVGAGFFDRVGKHIDDFNAGVAEAGTQLKTADQLTANLGKTSQEAFQKTFDGIQKTANGLKQLNAQQQKLARGAAAGAGAFTPKPAKAKGGGGGKKKGGGGGKSDAEKSVEQLQKFVDKTREAEGSVASFAKTLEENMSKTRQALEKGLITPEEAARFEAFFNKEYQLKVAKSTGIANMTSILDDLSRGFESFGKSAADSLADAIVEGEDLSDTLKQLAKDLAKMIIKVAILEPLMNSLFGKGGIGGLFSGTGGLALPQSVPLAPSGVAARGYAVAAVPPTPYGIVRASPRASSRAATTAARTPVVQQNVGPMTINMSGTPAVSASTQQARDLGVKIRASVTQILAEEQRPGGILSSRGRRA